MKKQFTPQERDAFAKAVSAVEGIHFTREDDAFFKNITTLDKNPATILKQVLSRALKKA